MELFGGTLRAAASLNRKNGFRFRGAGGNTNFSELPHLKRLRAPPSKAFFVILVLEYEESPVSASVLVNIYSRSEALYQPRFSSWAMSSAWSIFKKTPYFEIAVKTEEQITAEQAWYRSEKVWLVHKDGFSL
ncbi:hypothetical protein CRENBAI_009431, partial [Crenichthys baileyi]